MKGDIDDPVERAAQLNRCGLLAPWVAALPPEAHRQNAEWFSLAHELNEHVQEVVLTEAPRIAGEPGLSLVHVTMTAMLRSLADYQSALILAERGIVVQSMTLSRGIFETGFWLAWISKDGQVAVDALIADELGSQHSYHKWCVARAERLSRVDDEARERKAEVARIEALGKAAYKRFTNIQELASKGRGIDFYGFYKQLSASAAHVSLHSLTHHHHLDEEDRSWTLRLGPQVERIPMALRYACLGILFNMASWTEIIQGPDEPGDDDLKTLWERLTIMGSAIS